jgi:hypothetical protein
MMPAVRVLVVTDHTEATPELLEAIRGRVGQGPAQFRVLVPNPAHAEAHLRHPERHERAEEAERVLHDSLPAFEQAAGGRVIGSVSIRSDPYDAVEETLLDEPIDEFIVALAPHGLSRALHLDLPHRLAHFGLPVTTVAASG